MSNSRSPKRPRIASEAPPRPPLRHIVAASVAVSLPLMTMALISNSISDLLFLPPIGAAMALIVGAPNLPLAQPRNVVVGHLIGCITGILMSRLLGVSIITAAIAAGIAFALMLIARAAHSPATATAIVTALMPHGPDISNDFRLLGLVFASSIMIVVLGILANRLRGLRYPTYWW
ncbi:HPP family protein [Corynebacterium amycolatum]|uniref:HPP family protein n=1 Tax=Corynebacterium amycolatum TaxID=43765 RepID=UPI002551A90F|nr:HPP family protein [Corynebacterium amycolatum]MDK8819789.1 HPP family protein [Corynebacterium amycolatum]